MRQAVIAFGVLVLLMLAGQRVFRRQRSGAPAHVPLADGKLVLRPPRRNAVMFGITALLPAGLLGALTFRAWSAGQAGVVGLATGVLATLGVAAFAVYQFAYASRAHLVVHDTAIEQVGVFKRRPIGWGSVASVAFNPAHHWLFVTVRDGTHLWLPADLAGMGDFATIALRRLSPAVLSKDPVVREVLEELAASAA
jgi:hypothetical protein